MRSARAGYWVRGGVGSRVSGALRLHPSRRVPPTTFPRAGPDFLASSFSILILDSGLGVEVGISAGRTEWPREQLAHVSGVETPAPVIASAKPAWAPASIDLLATGQGRTERASPCAAAPVVNHGSETYVCSPRTAHSRGRR